MSDDRSLPPNPTVGIHREHVDDTDTPAEQGPAPDNLDRPAAVRTPVPGQGLTGSEVASLGQGEDTNDDPSDPDTQP